MLHRSLFFYLCMYILLSFSSASACDCSRVNAYFHHLQDGTLHKDSHIFLSVSRAFNDFPLKVELRELESGKLLRSNQTIYPQSIGRIVEVEPENDLEPGIFYQVTIKLISHTQEKIVFIDSFEANSKSAPEVLSTPFIYGYSHSKGDFCNGESINLKLEAPVAENVIYKISSDENSFEPAYFLAWSNQEGASFVHLGDFQCGQNFSIPEEEIYLEIQAISWTGLQSPAVPLEMDLSNPEDGWFKCHGLSDPQEKPACFDCLLNPFCRVE